MRVLGLEIRRVRAAEDGGGAKDGQDARRALNAAVRARHPRFLDALIADARITAAYRGERHEFRSRAGGVLQALRLMLVTDAFLGLAAYRLKARLQARGIPVLPWIAHRVAMMTGQISIGEHVVLDPGVLIPHGQVVVSGLVQIQSGAILLPWVTVDMIAGEMMGPTIGAGSRIGTGAKVLGPVEVGANSRIAPNAVVLNDVPAGATVVGMPARAVADERALQARKQEPPLARQAEPPALPSGEEARDAPRASRGRALPRGQQEANGPGDREMRRLAAGSAARTPQGDRQRAAHRGRGHGEGTAAGDGQAGRARALKERPEQPGTRRSRWLTPSAAWVVLGMTVVAAVLRSIAFDEALYGDELSTYAAVTISDSPGDVIDLIRADETRISTGAYVIELTPPLFFLLSWLSAQIGDPTETLRLPSLLAGVLTIPVTYMLGLKTVGRPAALVGAGLAVVNPFLIFFSVEARAFGLMALVVAGSTLALVNAVRGGSWWWWAAYAGASCAAIYTHYVAVSVLVAQFLWALWFHREHWRALILANVLAAAAFVPWLGEFFDDGRSPYNVIELLHPFSVDALVSDVGAWAAGSPFVSTDMVPGQEMMIVIGVGLAVALAWAVYRFATLARAGHWWRPSPGLALILLTAFSTPVVLAVYSAVGTDVLLSRNLAVASPALMLALAALVTAPPMPVRLLAGALVALGLTVGAIKILSDDGRRPDYRAAAEYVEARTNPGDPVYDVPLFQIREGPLSRGLDIYLSDHPVKHPEDLTAAARKQRAERLALVVLAPRFRGVGPNGLAEQPFPRRFSLIESRVFPGGLDLGAYIFEATGEAGRP